MEGLQRDGGSTVRSIVYSKMKSPQQEKACLRLEDLQLNGGSTVGERELESGGSIAR